MLLTLTTTLSPATDLGYLLHKRPGKLQTFPLAFGQAHVFYPEATPERCTAALLLDIDPIQLFRSRRGASSSSFALEQYVNDRPYVASSFLSVALAQVYGSALAGQCKDRPELVSQAIPLTARICVLPSRGAGLIERLFAPLGYNVRVENGLLDPQYPEWGESHAFTVELEAVTPLKLLLAHLYVLIPVLDNDKHYYVGEDEIAKLLARGEGWLSGHPERSLIVDRYLRHRRPLTRSALELLREEDASAADPSTAAVAADLSTAAEAADPSTAAVAADLSTAAEAAGLSTAAVAADPTAASAAEAAEIDGLESPAAGDTDAAMVITASAEAAIMEPVEAVAADALAADAETDPDLSAKERSRLKETLVEKSIGLNQQRLEAVYAELKASGAHRVVDLGCGEGKLLRLLLADWQFSEILGMDVSARGLEIAQDRLNLERLPEKQRKRIRLIQGSLLYRDRRLAGFDAAALVEVIEHLEPARLEVMERVVFGSARPGMLIISTPNREYNRMWPSLPAGKFRHPDHHFEWSREEFQAWAGRAAQTYGYSVTFKPIGPEDSEAGPPTQMAVFRQEGSPR